MSVRPYDYRLDALFQRAGRARRARVETHEACAVHDGLDNPCDERSTAQVAHLLGHLDAPRDDHVVVADHVLVAVVGAALERVGGAAEQVPVQGRVDVGEDGEEAERAAWWRWRAQGRDRVDVVAQGEELEEACADPVAEDAEPARLGQRARVSSRTIRGEKDRESSGRTASRTR